MKKTYLSLAVLTLSCHFSESQITSSSFAIPVEIAVGPQPANVCAFDANGDGKLDIVVANSSGANQNKDVSFIRNIISESGVALTSSSFNQPDTLRSTYTFPQGVASADFDGDGKMDFAENEAGSSMFFTIFKNIGTSVNDLTSNLFDTLGVPGSGFSVGLAVADFDKDGKPDFVSAHALTNTLEITRNASTPGNFSFDSTVIYGCIGNPRNFALGDLNSDGKKDIVICGGTGFSICRNYSHPGHISFNRKDSLITGTKDAAVGDIDGDGKNDLVILFNNSLSVYRNVSTSTVTIAFATPLTFSVNGSARVVVGDLDSDGKPDVVVSNGAGISIIQNTSTTGLISFASSVDFASGNSASGIALVDLNQDNRLDIIVTNKNTGSASGTISIFENQIQTGIKENQQVSSVLSVFPNPSSEMPAITLSMTQQENVCVKIMDASGREIVEILNSTLSAGIYQLNVPEKHIAQGVYFVKAAIGQSVKVQKIIIVK